MNNCPTFSLADLPKDRQFVLTQRQIVAIEQAELARGAPLMERAGRACADLIRQLYPELKKCFIAAGSGNNGGDAWVCARHLAQAGVELFSYVDSEPRSPMAHEAWQACREFPLKEQSRTEPISGEVELIVDGLLGSGLQGEPRGEACDLIQAMNAASVPIVAIDLPSGISGDGDFSAKVDVCATHTLSYLALKPGLFTPRGFARCGQVWFCALGAADELYREHAPAYHLAISPPCLTRAPDVHKGSFGQVWVVGGQGVQEGDSMAGASLLCARASLRMGCGLARIFTHSDHVNSLPAALPDCIYADALADFPNLSKHVVVVLGSGLGQSSWSRQVFAKTIALSTAMVIDADGLNVLAEDKTWRTQLIDKTTVLTPHPREAARLLAVDSQTIQHDRHAAVMELAKQYQSIVVLKGRGSLISDGQTVHLCPFGNPAMAVAGMGDVLAGMIGSLLAQGVPPLSAAAQAVALHALTGDELFHRFRWGLIASDLCEALRF